MTIKSVTLKVELTDEQMAENDLCENLEYLEQMLEDYDINGLYMSRINNKVEMFFSPTFFEMKKKNSRNAGRRKKAAYDVNTKVIRKYSDGHEYETNKILKYSDIMIKLNDGASLEEMLDYTNLKQATYYRHLKAMKKSSNYKKIDVDKLYDNEYINSLGSIDRYF